LIFTGLRHQTTAYVYGVSGYGLINSNDLLSMVKYLDKSTGEASSSASDQVVYDALGRVLTKNDQNGSVHLYG
jgi:hypothetical protein